MWSNYPDIKPAASGYYYTLYLNPDHDLQTYLKAIWYDKANESWVHWRPHEYREGIVPQVERFVEASRNDYYVPCQLWAQENWEDLKDFN